jgi:hypothetical protein
MDNSGASGGTGGYVGLLSFFSFAFSVIAAVLAIDLYALLRTGRSGSTWRVLITASVIFALMHALRLAQALDFDLPLLTNLSEIVELVFVMALAYAFYLQRKVFKAHGPRESGLAPEADLDNEFEAAQEPPPHFPSATSFPSPPVSDAPDDGEESRHAEGNEGKDESSEWARLNGQSEVPKRPATGAR